MRANTNKLNFYVSDAVRKKLERLSKNSGLTMTAVITKLILECEIHPLKTDELLKIYNELNHIGNNINQIAHIANAERHISDDRIDSSVNLKHTYQIINYSNTLDYLQNLWYNTYKKVCCASFCGCCRPVLRTACTIDGCTKMSLQANIFVYGIIISIRIGGLDYVYRQRARAFGS